MNFRFAVTLLALTIPCFAMAEKPLDSPPTKAVLEKQKKKTAESTKKEQKEKWNIDHAVELAVQNNPQIKQAERELEAIKENEDQAIAGFLPQVHGDVQYGRQRNALGGTSFKYSDVNTQNLRISQALLNARTLSRYDTAILQIEHAKFRLQDITQQIILQTRIAYINLVFDKHLLKIADASKQLHKKHLLITKDRFKLGELSHTDYSQSSARYTLALSNTIDAKNQYESSKYELEKLIMQEVPADKIVIEIENPKIPKTLKKALKLAETQNLSLIQTEIELKLAKENIDLAVADNLPTLSLEASLNREEESGLLAQEYDSDSVALRVSVPIFEGGAGLSEVSQARRSSQAKDFELIDKKKEIIRSVKSIWEYIKTSEKSLSLNLKAIKASERALEGTKAEEQVGVRSVLDVLNAEQERINAVTNLVRSKRQELTNYYRLLNLCGLI